MNGTQVPLLRWRSHPSTRRRSCRSKLAYKMVQSGSVHLLNHLISSPSAAASIFILYSSLSIWVLIHTRTSLHAWQCLPGLSSLFRHGCYYPTWLTLSILLATHLKIATAKWPLAARTSPRIPAVCSLTSLFYRYLSNRFRNVKKVMHTRDSQEGYTGVATVASAQSAAKIKRLVSIWTVDRLSFAEVGPCGELDFRGPP